MGTIFKTTKRGKQQAKYSIEYELADGRLRREVAYRDKGSSLQLLAKRERAVAQGKEGLVDQYRDHRRKGVPEHINDFEKYLERGGSPDRKGRPGAKHINQSVGRLRRALAQATTLDGLNREGALDFFDGYPMTERTRDHYAATLEQFGEWLVDESRCPTNPFRKLGRTATDATTTINRRALGVDELSNLVEATVVRPVQEYRRTHPRASSAYLTRLESKGRDRSVLYLTAAYTGLRVKECRALVWRDVHLEEHPPHVTVIAQSAKSKRTERVPLVPWLVELLRGYREARAQELGRVVGARDPVFHVSSKLPEMVQKDAVWAGLGTFDPNTYTDRQRLRHTYVDEKGLRLDFHCLRTTLRTMLDQVVPAVGGRVINVIMRHRPTGIGEIHYSKVDLEDAFQAVSRLPVPAVVEGVSAYVSVENPPEEASGGNRWQPRAERAGGQAHAL